MESGLELRSINDTQNFKSFKLFSVSKTRVRFSVKTHNGFLSVSSTCMYFNVLQKLHHTNPRNIVIVSLIVRNWGWFRLYILII